MGLSEKESIIKAITDKDRLVEEVGEFIRSASVQDRKMLVEFMLTRSMQNNMRKQLTGVDFINSDGDVCSDKGIPHRITIGYYYTKDEFYG